MAPLPRDRSGCSSSPMKLDTTPARMELQEDDEQSPDLEGLGVAFDVEVRNTELEDHFNSKMKHIAKMESHSRVAVLLIDWELEEKDYLDTAEEVNRLAAVFKDHYNFSIHKRRLHTKKGKSAKHQMNKHLSDFVYEEDNEDTLLIIYYAGHGVKDEKGVLRLAGGSPKKGDKSLKQIVWEQAERVLDDTQADRFLIFDCCYAGQLARSARAANTKIFDFLGATQKDSTAISPGPESFTTALTWALKELASKKGFTTAQLQHKITEAENFPSDLQVPVVSERGEPSLRRLKIAPLPKTPKAVSLEKGQDEKAPTVEYSIKLQLLFSKCPTIAIIDDLTKSLRQLVKVTDSPLQQVLWRGLFSENTLPKDFDFSHVARRMLFNLRRRSISKKFRPRPVSASSGRIVDSPADGPEPMPEAIGDANQLRHKSPSSCRNLRPVSMSNGGGIDSPADDTEPLSEELEDGPARKRKRVQ